MGTVQYRLYRDSDAEGVVALLKNNGFYIARIEPDLTAERFREVQRQRGMCFALVGELDGRIIALHALYPTGTDRVASPHQVFCSSLLIDRAYRKHLYSFPEMYRLMLYHLEEHYPKVTELLMEIMERDLSPLYLQRMFGSVMLDDSMPNPNERIMHNYSPAIRHFFRPMRSVNPQDLASAYRHVDKRRVMEKDPVKEGRFVTIPVRFSEGQLEADVNIYSGRVCRFRVEAMGQSGRIEDGGIRLFNDAGTPVRWQAAWADEAGRELDRASVDVEPGGSGLIPMPAGAKRVEILQEERKLAFCLCPDEDWKEDPYGLEPADEPGAEPFTLKRRTGMLAVTGAGEKRVLFQEVWPYFTAPYLFGTLVNDPDRAIEFCPGPEEGMAFARCVRDGYEIDRTYRVGADAASVATRVKRLPDAPADAPFEPIFALHLQDMDGSCDLCRADGSIVSRAFDYQRDYAYTYEEFMFYEFGVQDYARPRLEKIVLRFGDARYTVTADRPFRAYLQCTYLFIKFLPASAEAAGWEWRDGEADLGTLRIQKEL